MKICLVARGSLAEEHPHAFFIGALAEKGAEVEVVDCEGQSAIALGVRLAARLDRNEVKRLVLWGAEEAALEMRSVAGIGRMVIVPAPGHRVERPALWWQQFQTHRFLAFSRLLHEQLLQTGLASAHFQYYEPAVPPSHLVDVDTERSALLWERAGSTAESIQWAVVQCRAMGLQRLQVANCSRNEGYDRIQRLRLDLAGFLDFVPPGTANDAASLDQLLRLHACFIAPYPSEGICPVLMRAIAVGRIVIAPDVAPVRDYVGHLATGLLYDPADPVALPWLDSGKLRDLSSAARARSARGSARWQADTERLYSIVVEDGRRWSTSDRAADFGNMIRRRANEAARQIAATNLSKSERSSFVAVPTPGN